jgi:hypothetical protein
MQRENLVPDLVQIWTKMVGRINLVAMLHIHK